MKVLILFVITFVVMVVGLSLIFNYQHQKNLKIAKIVNEAEQSLSDVQKTQYQFQSAHYRHNPENEQVNKVVSHDQNKGFY